MKRIAVYCGTSKGSDPSYVQKAWILRKYFAEQGYKISPWCRVQLALWVPFKMVY